MKKITQEDIILAAKEVAKITGLKKMVIIGAGSTAFTLGNPEHSTSDIDLFTPENETKELDTVIEKLGEGSNFHKDNNFYIERVGSWTIISQPKGWEARAEIIKIPEISAEIHVLSLLDLIYNKLEVGRKKDCDFIVKLIDTNKVKESAIKNFLQTCEIDEETREVMLEKFDKDVAKHLSPQFKPLKLKRQKITPHLTSLS